MRIDFNENWLFTGRDGRKIKIDLPYDAMIHEEREADCPNGINTGYFPGGIYRYEKTFELKETAGKKIFLHFEGVYRNCEILVNGKKAGSHRYGYTCFDIDISDHVKDGENGICVIVDNSLEPNCRWYSGSGIYRDVTMYILDEDYIDLFRVKTVSCDPAVIEVSAKTGKGSKVKTEIYDGEKLLYSGDTGRIEIPEAKLWSAETPYLYTVRVFTEKDERTVRYGIRQLEWSAEKGLLVNGESVLLRGGCIHHDHGILGANEYYDAEYRRISILKENGFNAVRMAHNPASEITLDICDELGMYVMDEAFDGWYIPKTYHDYARDFEECWREDLRALAASAYNHSSVIMYSVGNEVSETAEEKGCEVCGELSSYLKSLDDTRPITAGINVLLNVYAKMGLGVYKEKGKYEAVPLKKGKGYREKKTGSAFFNMMAQKLGKLMFVMSRGSKGDKACKGAAERLDILGLNYASSRYDEDVRKYPGRMMVGSETMVADLPYNWERVKKYPQLVGDFVWSAWDYLGEACIGDWSYDSYKGLPLLAGQGMIDITGKPLAAMRYMQVVWGLKEEPFIALRPLNHADEIPHKGSWQFTNAIDSYSWDGYEGKKAVAEVYGRGERAAFYLNGKLIGEKKYKDFKAIFSFPYEKGTLTAVSLDKNGAILSESELSSGKDETVLSVKSDRKTLKKGQLAYLEIEFTDEEGNLKPYIEKEVKVEVKGPCKLLGFGSALCKSDEVYTDDIHKSYRGRCLAVIEGKETGMTEIKISSKGYPDTNLMIEVKE